MIDSFVQILRMENIFQKVRHSSFLKEFFHFSATIAFLQASRFFVSLLAARQLGPSNWGMWQILWLVIVYSSVAHLGVINGMNRNIPFYIGQGNHRMVAEISGAAFMVAMVSTSLCSLLLLTISFYFEENRFTLPFRLTLLLLLVHQLHAYLQVSLKSRSRFAELSKQNFVFALIYMLLVIPMLHFYGIEGLILGQCGAVLATSVFILKTSALRIRFTFSFKESINMIKIGLPIMLAGILYALMATADRWIIKSYLGIDQIGQYSVAIMVTGVLSIIPITVSQQIYPRMAQSWGRNCDFKELNEWVRKQHLSSIILTFPFMIVAYYLFPILIEAYLPAYSQGINAMRIIIFACLFLCIAIGYGNCLNTIGRQVYSMIVQGCCIVFNIYFSILFVKLGYGVNGVAFGTLLTFVAYALALSIIYRAIVRQQYK